MFVLGILSGILPGLGPSLCRWNSLFPIHSLSKHVTNASEKPDVHPESPAHESPLMEEPHGQGRQWDGRIKGPFLSEGELTAENRRVNDAEAGLWR